MNSAPLVPIESPPLPPRVVTPLRRHVSQSKGLHARGPEPRRYACEGREAAYRGEVFKLGPKVIFEASDPTVDEWQRLFRVLYADGGLFAHGVTYLEFLDLRLSPKSENERTAHFKELAECGSGAMPRTQAEMRHRLEADDLASDQSAVQQMSLAL